MALKTFFDTHDVGEPFPDGFPKEDQEWIKTEERKFARELMGWYRKVIANIVSVTDKRITEAQKINVSGKLRKLDAGDLLIWFDNDVIWSGFSEDLKYLIKSFIEKLLKHKVNQRIDEEIQLDMNYLDPSVLEQVGKHTANLVAGITGDIRQRIRDVVYTGLNEGKKISEVRGGISALKDSGQNIFTPERALKIASTEIIRAYNQGAVARYKSSGVVRGMKWISASVGYCPRCGALDGKVVPLGEVFYFDPKFGDGLPPRHPHCRCTVAPITLKEAKESGIAELQNDYRNSISDLWDNDAYTIVNGIKITGGARGHYMRRHGAEINGRSPDIKDMASAERLLVDMLNGLFGEPRRAGMSEEYVAPFEGHLLSVIIERNQAGEKIVYSVIPKKK